MRPKPDNRDKLLLPGAVAWSALVNSVSKCNGHVVALTVKQQRRTFNAVDQVSKAWLSSSQPRSCPIQHIFRDPPRCFIQAERASASAVDFKGSNLLVHYVETLELKEMCVKAVFSCLW